MTIEYNPDPATFLADYYTAPPEWLVDAASCAQSSPTLAGLFDNLVDASMAAEGGGPEEAVVIASDAIESMMAERL